MKHFSKITLSLSALILAIFLAACSTEADSTNTKTESYVITFNPNGGTIITKKQTIEGNKEANIASASALGLSYNSMKFLGWALTSSANEAAYGDGAKIILSENITLYAVWKDTSPKITLSTSKDSVYKGENIELSVGFENFTEIPSSLDVYKSNSESIATGVSVTDGKISFSSAGLDDGSHSLFVQAGNTKSNTASITIIEKAIQITAVSDNVFSGVLSGAAIEFSVSFENFIENPGTLDVYESNKSEPVATGVSVTDGKISFSSMSLDAGTYNFYIKTNGISSNIINIQIEKKEIKLNSTDTSVFVGNTIDIPIEFLNYTEEPTSVDVYKNDESLPFLTNISVSNNKISIPLSLDLENTSIYVKADSESSNALSIGAVGLLNQDGSYSVSISSLNKVA